MRRSIRPAALAAGVALVLSGCAAGSTVAGLQPPPAPVTSVAPLAAPHARAIVSRAFTAASQAESATGAQADQARATAYTGPALTAARAQARLDSVQPGLGGGSPALSPSQPGLLALSRGFGWPRVMVAQTVPAEGSLPVLHLLTSPRRGHAVPHRHLGEHAAQLHRAPVRPARAGVAAGHRRHGARGQARDPAHDVRRVAVLPVAARGRPGVRRRPVRHADPSERRHAGDSRSPRSPASPSGTRSSRAGPTPWSRPAAERSSSR